MFARPENGETPLAQPRRKGFTKAGKREGERETEEKRRERYASPAYALLNDRQREVQSAAVNYPFGRRRV